MSQNVLLQVVLVVFAYLMGSLPFGYWIGKIAKGGAFDIRNYGSGNIGFTAIGREVSWGIAIPVLILDVFKAWGPVTVAKAEFGVNFGMLCLIFVMLGHAYSLYFWITEKHPGGGKSVAAALGGIVALHPAIAGWSLIVWAIILLCTRTMSIASMLGSVCAFLLTFRIHIGMGLEVSFGYDLGTTWHVFFGLVSLLIVIFHRRNLGRLLHRNEKPLFQWRDLSKLWQRKQLTQAAELVVWFMIHPLEWSDLMQSVLLWWIYWMGKWPWSTRIGIWILSILPVIENAEVTGITLKDEKETRVKIKTGAILYLSGMIEMVKLAEEVDAGRMTVGYGPDDVSPELYKKASLLRDRLWKHLQSGTVQGRRIGSHVSGLGALLSTRFGGGTKLQTWATNERNLGSIVENGAAFTSVTTVRAAGQQTRVPLHLAKAVIYGASGFIGRITTTYLESVCAQVTAIGRDATKLRGFAKTTRISTDPRDGYDADIVILVTNSTVPIITLENCLSYKPGTVFIDTATPANFDRRILKEHPELDFKLVCCGPVKLPHKEGERIKSGVNWHFGYDEDGNPRVPACVVQTIMDEYDPKGAAKHASRGAWVKLADMEYYAQLGDSLGFVPEPSEVSEAEIFADDVDVVAILTA